MKKEYKYPALTADVIVFAILEKDLYVLLIQRKNEPFRDCWAIPGGFVEDNEELETAARRELEEETSLKNIHLEQLGAFGRVNRDPRGRTVSTVYYACINPTNHYIMAQDDAKDAQWFKIKELPPLAFDHAEIMTSALETMRIKTENTPIASRFLPKEFSLSQLQEVYEIILDRKLDHGRFKCEILKNNFLEKIGESEYKFAENIKFSSRYF